MFKFLIMFKQSSADHLRVSWIDIIIFVSSIIRSAPKQHYFLCSSLIVSLLITLVVNHETFALLTLQRQIFTTPY